jgi:hypothetical protein
VSVFVTNTDAGKIVSLFKDQQSFNIIFSVISVVFTFYNLRLVYKILRVAFK